VSKTRVWGFWRELGTCFAVLKIVILSALFAVLLLADVVDPIRQRFKDGFDHF